MVSEGRVTGGPRLPIMGGASGAEASSVAPPACARACARLRPIPRDRQATVRRASLTSGRGRGAGCVRERTDEWLRGRRRLAKEVDNDPNRWLIDHLPGGDGRGPTGSSGMPQVGSDDDAIEVAVIQELADPGRIRRARKCYRGEQERDGHENHRHDGSYQTHARKPSANMAGLQLARADDEPRSRGHGGTIAGEPDVARRRGVLVGEKAMSFGWARAPISALMILARMAYSVLSAASALSSQYVIPISRYIIVAVPRCS